MLESEIRDMLRAKAEHAFDGEPLAAPPLSRVRARRASNGLAMVAAVGALAVVATTVAGRLTAQPIHPIGPVPKVTATYSIPGEPTDVAYGFGSVWVTTEDAILRIAPNNGQVQARFADFPEETTPRTTGLSVNRIVVGSDAVYAVVIDDGYRTSVGPTATTQPSSNGIGSIGGSISVAPPPAGFVPKWGVVRIDPASNQTQSSGLLHESVPVSMTPDADGVWVAARRTNADTDSDVGMLVRVTFTPRQNEFLHIFDLPRGEPAGISSDDSSVWVGLRGVDAVVRLDRKDAKELARVGIADPVNLVLAGEELFVSYAGPHGWGFDRFDAESLRRRETTGAGIPDDTVAEMVGAKGYVWVLLDADDNILQGGLYWIDRSTGRIVERIKVPAFSRELTPGDAVLWIVGGATGDAKLYRLTLPTGLQ